MSETTLYVYEVSAISVTTTNGVAVPSVLEKALWGDAFSWEKPNDLVLTLPETTTAIVYNDADGLLQDDPYSGSSVTDQTLLEETTLNGTTYSPSEGTVRWGYPSPVTVESEYSVELLGSDGETYTLVGISITTGYNTEIVGVAFDGAQPPAGVTLTYVQGNSTYQSTGPNLDPTPTVPCFAAGTKIETPNGEVPIQYLKVGDLVSTLDHGPRPILWIGHSTVDGRSKLAPIQIEAEALGNRNALKVSPNHRFLLHGADIELLFGEESVFAPAKALVNDISIRRSPCHRVTYFHILLSGHEIIFSEGIATESLFTGPMAMSALDDAARNELYEIFGDALPDAATLSRPEITVSEATALKLAPSPASRHQIYFTGRI
ncbi:Hint domain-containing protein [Celeribacter persicus]|uniref:Hint domain-containing protein n=1 Tax=Celeribacter persicus TaxID=1651082 RepID=A0A2T5HLY7_9RHOB|nr:Hint domain-containing protein [Celeribacter persicus]PTQ72598.1 Hint domain-containing protein [Celeribacter persicus]